MLVSSPAASAPVDYYLRFNIQRFITRRVHHVRYFLNMYNSTLRRKELWVTGNLVLVALLQYCSLDTLTALMYTISQRLQLIGRSGVSSINAGSVACSGWSVPAWCAG